MTDVLIRGVPEDVVAVIDARAARLGVSRVEYLRRLLAHEADVTPETVVVEDLRRLGADLADLDDPEVMRGAWE